MSRKRKASVKGMGSEILGKAEGAEVAPAEKAEEKLESEEMVPTTTEEAELEETPKSKTRSGEAPPPPSPSTSPPPPPAISPTAPPPAKPKFTPTPARPEHLLEMEEEIAPPVVEAEEVVGVPMAIEEAIPEVAAEEMGMESEEMAWVGDVRRAVVEEIRLAAAEEERERDFLKRKLTAADLQYFQDIPKTIDDLYRRVAKEVKDSSAVSNYCLEQLHRARVAYMKGEVGSAAEAEYRVEQVRAKLERVEISEKTTRGVKVHLLLAWQFILLLVFGAMIVSARAAALLGAVFPMLPTLYMDPAAAHAMAAIGWGGLGGVVNSLYNIPWFVQFREYDPGYNMSYVVGPIKGALLGAIVFLIFSAGLLATGSDLTRLQAGTAAAYLVYLAACLGGYKQEYVYEMMDRLLKAIFKKPPLPAELEVGETEGSSLGG